MIAFWSAEGLWFVYKRIHSYLAHLVSHNIGSKLLFAGTFGLVGVIIGSSVQTKTPYSLQDQENLFANLRERADGSPIIVINYPEYYAVTNQPSPLPLLIFAAPYETYLDYRVDGGCDKLITNVRTSNYQKIYVHINRARSYSPCFDALFTAINQESDLRERFERIKR